MALRMLSEGDSREGCNEFHRGYITLQHEHCKLLNSIGKRLDKDGITKQEFALIKKELRDFDEKLAAFRRLHKVG